eukprot:15469315-Alexandrium_andersonii.AAC.1
MAVRERHAYFTRNWFWCARAQRCAGASARHARTRDALGILRARATQVGCPFFCLSPSRRWMLCSGLGMGRLGKLVALACRRCRLSGSLRARAARLAGRAWT